jgi:hypothetical protein
VSLLLGASAALTAVLAKRLDIKLASSIAAIIPFLFVISFVFPNETLQRKSPEKPLMQYRDQVNENTILISDASMVHSVAWYLQRDDIYMIRRGEFAYGLDYPDARHRFLDKDRFASLLEKAAPAQSILMVCRKGCFEHITALLPPAFKKTTWGSFTFWFAPATGPSDQESGGSS